MIIARACDNCQETYDADTRYLNRGQGRFCSRKCSGEHVSNLKASEKKSNNHCAYCNEPLYISVKRAKNSKSGFFFCNRECQALGFTSPNVSVTPGPKGEPSRKTCSGPDCKVKTPNTLCAKCLREEKVSQWLRGDNSVTLNKGTNTETKPFVKQYLIETRGDACEVCGFDERAPDGRSIIQMDHVDGNCHNNDPSNLKLLCPNHHAMTPTYGSLNRGSGRAHRRKLSGA